MNYDILLQIYCIKQRLTFSNKSKPVDILCSKLAYSTDGFEVLNANKVELGYPKTSSIVLVIKPTDFIDFRLLRQGISQADTPLKQLIIGQRRCFTGHWPFDPGGKHMLKS